MIDSIGRATILVRDYDEALRFYVGALGFEVIADVRLESGFRALHVGPPGRPSIGLWLMQATGEVELARVGSQTGGEPCLVMYTSDCRQAYDDLSARGVEFLSPPVEGADDVHVHLRDLYGNEIVLVELRGG